MSLKVSDYEKNSYITVRMGKQQFLGRSIGGRDGQVSRCYSSSLNRTSNRVSGSVPGGFDSHALPPPAQNATPGLTPGVSSLTGQN
jgi:hypothetical protein